MIKKPRSRTKFPIIDLFAGAGGFGLAASLAGGQVRLSVELDEICCTTLEANSTSNSHRVERADVQNLTGQDLRRLSRLGRRDPLVIVGGPPCQPFSKGSYWTDPGHDASYRRARARGEAAHRPNPITRAKPDERRDLLKEFWRLVVDAKADGFVMENVTSLLHPRNIAMFRKLVRAFEGEGYMCTVVAADATSYGVPQKRARVVVMGSRFEFPKPPSRLFKASSRDSSLLPDPPEVGRFIEAFAGPEYYEDGERVEGRWAECLQEIPPGQNYKYLTAWAGHPRPMFEAETRFWNFLLKLSPKAPSWTINANPGPWVGPFHWENRRLRTPELAAIQTFPPGYVFKGSRRERVRQVGNAVPPLLAMPMIKSLLKTLPR